ncbi:hypothetical protein [Nonomuraea jabiensis]|uniref:hypothetical protein n=1 Tax=Nonomuraea jabiensis TaxID=882448 RepID=UPI0036A39E72
MSTDNLLPPLHCEITRDPGAPRRRVRDYAALAGLCATRLIVAVNEAATNVIEHGGVPARRDAEGVWVEVVDTAGTLAAEYLRGGPARSGARVRPVTGQAVVRSGPTRPSRQELAAAHALPTGIDPAGSPIRLTGSG